MSPRRVYLAGPIKGLTFAEATQWRRDAATLLAPLGILTINPVEQDLEVYQDIPLGCSAEGLMSTPRAIVAKDRHYVQQADAVLACFHGCRQISIGTCVEFGWADAYRKPIVTIMGEANLHDHSFVRELSGWVVPSLDQAVTVLHQLLGK